MLKIKWDEREVGLMGRWVIMGLFVCVCVCVCVCVREREREKEPRGVCE